MREEDRGERTASSGSPHQSAQRERAALELHGIRATDRLWAALGPCVVRCNHHHGSGTEVQTDNARSALMSDARGLRPEA